MMGYIILILTFKIYFFVNHFFIFFEYYAWNEKWWDFHEGPEAKTPHSQWWGPGLIPGQGTRFHMPQIKVWLLQLKMKLHAATKTQSRQINKYFKK